MPWNEQLDSILIRFFGHVLVLKWLFWFANYDRCWSRPQWWPHLEHDHGLNAETYFKGILLPDVSNGFRINAIEVEDMPQPTISGMSAIEGVCSTDATTLGNGDNALVSIPVVGPDLNGGLNWSTIMNAVTNMGVLNMRGCVAGRIAAGCSELNGWASGFCWMKLSSQMKQNPRGSPQPRPLQPTSCPSFFGQLPAPLFFDLNTPTRAKTQLWSSK